MLPILNMAHHLKPLAHTEFTYILHFALLYITSMWKICAKFGTKSYGTVELDYRGTKLVMEARWRSQRNVIS
jgi:hypothetical protein